MTVKPRYPEGVELVALSRRTSEGVVVGLVDVSVQGHEATLESVAVHPDLRRQGVGRTLLETALASLRRRVHVCRGYELPVS